MSKIRVLLADDHPPIVEGLVTLLARHAIEVVGRATRTADVLAKYDECSPDVVVLDVRFGEVVTGLDVARSLLDAHPGARIVFYSQFDQDEILKEAYRVGAQGFVTKSKTLEVLADAIKHVHSGKMHFLPEIAERLAILNVRGDNSPLTSLDARELEVFRLLAQGMTNMEIAEAKGLSLKTISTTSQNIKDKLGVHRPADITRLAVRHKLIEA